MALFDSCVIPECLTAAGVGVAEAERPGLSRKSRCWREREKEPPAGSVNWRL